MELTDAYGLPLGIDPALSPSVALQREELEMDVQVYEPLPVQPPRALHLEAPNMEVQVYQPPLLQQRPFLEQAQVPSIPLTLTSLHVGPSIPRSIDDIRQIPDPPVHYTNTVENRRITSFARPTRYVTSPTEPHWPQLPFSVSFDPDRG